MQHKRRSTLKPMQKPGVWERGYLSHVYWCKTVKMGVIHTGLRGSWDGAYRWTCSQANIQGVAQSLKNAKNQVEALVLAGIYQMDLF